MDCIIHIGTGKTGTTSIQNVLSRRRAALQRAGVLYPETLGRTNHEAAAVFAAEFEPGFTPRKARGVSDAAALEAFRTELRQRLQEEIRQSGCSRVILSNEHLFEKVRSPAQAAITLRVFERARLTGGDVVTDFAEAAGLDSALVAPGPDIAAVGTSRQSFDAAAVAFLKRFNAEVTQLLNARGDKPGLEAFRAIPHRSTIARCIEEMNHKGPGFAFDAETAAQIRQQHEAANAAMFARFGAAPFAPAVASKGGADPAAALDIDHAFALFARMWAETALAPTGAAP